jgi:hypothetical protein
MSDKRYEMYGINDMAKTFLARLTPAERDELLALEIRWREVAGLHKKEGRDHRDVTKDWIEEHGGSRECWGGIHTCTVKVGRQ